MGGELLDLIMHATSHALAFDSALLRISQLDVDQIAHVRWPRLGSHESELAPCTYIVHNV